MKRILALALTFVLAISLALPAVAAEELNPPLWQEFGCASREECITDWFGGDESAYQSVIDSRLERERWETTMADEIAAFDADAYWDSGACWMSTYYASKEEFMEEWLLETEEDFRACMLEDWLDEQWWAYEKATEVERTRAKLGGVEGQIGVMLDGKYIQFPDAVPEMKDGRTMVPCRPLLEALGFTVGGGDGQVTGTCSGQILRFRVGERTAQLATADGSKVSTIDLGAPSYYKNGRTYIPVRAVAEALGCDVFWDSDYETAVLLQRSAVEEQLNENFTVLNQMLSSMIRDADKNYKTAVRMDADLTMLDSINGDKTYHMNADVEILQSGNVLNLTANMNLAALLDVEDLADELSPTELLALRTTLRNTKVQVIYDGDEGVLYAKLPALSLLTYGAYPSNSWLSMDVGTAEELGGMTSGASVGALLYESELRWADMGSYFGTSPVFLYGEMLGSAEQAAAYLGDSCFAQNGGYSVLRYGQEEYEAALEAQYGEGAADWASDFEQLDVELKVARSGEATYRVLMQTKNSYYGDEVFLVDASGSVSATKVDMKLLFKLKNELNLTLRYTADTAVTTQAPVTAPAAGETVIDPYEDLYGEWDPAPAA